MPILQMGKRRLREMEECGQRGRAGFRNLGLCNLRVAYREANANLAPRAAQMVLSITGSVLPFKAPETVPFMIPESQTGQLTLPSLQSPSLPYPPTRTQENI